MIRDGLFFNLPARLRLPPDAAAAELWLFNPATGTFVRAFGAADSPLLAPGPAPLAAEMVVLRGDPPDPVHIGGDYVWLRRYQPNVTLAPWGDITTVRGE